MTMRSVAWLGAIALLLAGFLLYDLSGPTTDQRRTEAARLVPGFDRRAVRRVTIARHGAAPFALVRQPPGQEPAWRLDPGGRRADDAAIEDLLTTVDFAEAERTADLTPEAAGLAPPAVVVGLDARTLRIGRADATGRAVFVQLGDAREIRVAPARLRELADQDPTAFRDRRLFALALDAITMLTWTDPNGRGSGLARTSSGRWEAVGGEHRPVANDRVDEALRRLTAVRVDSYQPGPFAPAPGQARITVGAAGGGTVVTIAGPSCANGGTALGRAAPDGTEGACVRADALAAVWPALSAAAEPDLRLLSQPPEAVTRVELAEGERRLALVRERNWQFVTPAVSYQPDPVVVADWLATLHRTRRDAAVGAKPRQLRVVGRFPESVDVSGPKEAYALLEPDPLRFRDRSVLSFAHFDVRRLHRAAPGEPPVEATTSDGDLWLPTTIDRADAARIVTALGDLDATSFLSAAPRAKPQVTLEVDIQTPGDPKPTRHTVTVYADCSARLDGKLSFTVAAPQCEDLKLPLAPQRP